MFGREKKNPSHPKLSDNIPTPSPFPNARTFQFDSAWKFPPLSEVATCFMNRTLPKLKQAGRMCPSESAERDQLQGIYMAGRSQWGPGCDPSKSVNRHCGAPKGGYTESKRTALPSPPLSAELVAFSFGELESKRVSTKFSGAASRFFDRRVEQASSRGHWECVCMSVFEEGMRWRCGFNP